MRELKHIILKDKQGGLVTVTASHIDQISEAVADFAANVTDSKASIITTYNFLLGQVCFGLSSN
jgi:hypothetical protein